MQVDIDAINSNHDEKKILEERRARLSSIRSSQISDTEVPPDYFESDLPDPLGSKFRDLLTEIIRFQPSNDPPSAEYDDISQRIQSNINENPIFVHTVSETHLGCSLLQAMSTRLTDTELACPVIKFTIEKNPTALLWKGDIEPATPPISPLYTIASEHCTLMPWIATHFPHVLEHPEILKFPPQCLLLGAYRGGRCNASIVRQFFEKFPQGLSQHVTPKQLFEQSFEAGSEHWAPETQGSLLPLNRVIFESERCDVDLFKWMASQFPEAALSKDFLSSGKTPLHVACESLGRDATSEEISTETKRRMKEIALFLIINHPRSIRIMDNMNRLPVHFLVKRCNRRSVQEVMDPLLREYPESMNVPSNHFPTPKSIPFVQQIGSLHDLERKLEEEVQSLKTMSDTLLHAASCSKSELWTSFPTVFETWAIMRRSQECQHRINKELPNEIRRICNLYEGEDPDSDFDEDDIDDDDDDSVLDIEAEIMIDNDPLSDVEDPRDEIDSDFEEEALVADGDDDHESDVEEHVEPLSDVEEARDEIDSDFEEEALIGENGYDSDVEEHVEPLSDVEEARDEIDSDFEEQEVDDGDEHVEDYIADEPLSDVEEARDEIDSDFELVEDGDGDIEMDLDSSFI